jgi:hypothetical protein
MFRTALVVLALTAATVTPASAAGADADTLFMASAAAAPMLAADIDWSLAPVHVGSPARGRILPALYVGLAGLNAFDAYSTLKGVKAGVGTESNPLLRGAANNPVALWAIKGGVTVGSVVFAERLWRAHRRTEAIAMMVVSNGVMAAVAAHNASIAGR